MIEPGDLIRVTGWPATKGKTFEVKQVDPYEGPSVGDRPGVATVQAWELEGGARGKLRAFPLSHCGPATPGHGINRGPALRLRRNKEAV